MAKLRVGLIGTSWWAEAMYLPALADHPDGQITMLCGRNALTAADVAKRWGIAATTTDWRELIDKVDAVIVASANDSHEEFTLAALAAGKHVLCEKPLAMNAAAAVRMVAAADRADVTTMTPFTYGWMPAFRWVKRLIDDGYIGTPYHVNLRYHTGFGRDGSYAWRFDQALSGGGVIGDLGSHWLHVVRNWLGEVDGISAFTGRIVDRAPRPDGTAYETAEDSGHMTLRFASGAHGLLQVTSLAYVGDGLSQIHAAEIHGSAGTLHVYVDWDTVQEVRGIRAGEPGRPQVLPIPEDIWDGARHDTVHNTQRDVFRQSNTMTRYWVSCAAAGVKCQPDLAEGARVQVLVDAALASAAEDSTMRKV
jgi:predicted dehydrogenase